MIEFLEEVLQDYVVRLGKEWVYRSFFGHGEDSWLSPFNISDFSRKSIFASMDVKN